MLEQNKFVSVQPDNRTLIEESLEYAWARILARATNPYPNLKNPQLTADEFVVLLAGERGVADWQPTDTIVQQRKTTDKAFPIHSKVGTRTGLKSALFALGFDAEIQKADLPYSIQITSWSGDGIGNDVLSRVYSRTVQYKSERDSFSIRVGIKSQGSIFFGGAVVSAPKAIVGPWVPPMIKSAGKIYTGGAVIAAMRVVAT
ncbi:phage tail protein [Vibrio anguillarum]|uniref:phage tail protein n=1 Tax=Vibrio anguillarum TaxID=55601 RepID=UPI001C9CB60C|nr:phage tail protein [Vibrio anguillarum]MBY7667267.1 phage tail protein [Vibrio anguillarum]